MTSERIPRVTYSRRPYAFALVALGLIVLAAWMNRGRLRPVGAGTVAPQFEVSDLRGSPARLSDYEGEVVMINIWATWCAPCRFEMPSMERLHQRFKDDGLRILAISVDAKLGEADQVGRPGGDLQAFADSLGLTFTILHDPSGEIQNLYQTTGVPETLLVGRDGVIYKKVAGPTEWDAPEHQELIRRLLVATE
jgi:cytochrome c biogenesis protein CcmG/thiol:disulfide interchange protein DsbE